MINKIKALWEKYSTLIILCGGLLGIFIIPRLLTRDWSAGLPSFPDFATLINFASFANSGQIGDTIGGTTAPFIGLLSAVLVYRALQAQIKANEIIQEQIKKQEKESAERQKHENFMKMYEAYVRVLGDGSLVERSNAMDPYPFHLSKGISFVELNPLMRMAYHLLKKELAQDDPQKWDNIRFFIAQLSEDELRAMARNCLRDDEGKNGLALVAKKTGLFQHLKNEKLKMLLKEEPDSDGFFDLKTTEDEYKDKSVMI